MTQNFSVIMPSVTFCPVKGILQMRFYRDILHFVEENI